MSSANLGHSDRLHGIRGELTVIKSLLYLADDATKQTDFFKQLTARFKRLNFMLAQLGLLDDLVSGVYECAFEPLKISHLNDILAIAEGAGSVKVVNVDDSDVLKVDIGLLGWLLRCICFYGAQPASGLFEIRNDELVIDISGLRDGLSRELIDKIKLVYAENNSDLNLVL